MSHRVLASVALVAISSLPFAAIAFAQPVPVPADPDEPYPPPSPTPPPAPPVADPAPIVIVNPPPRATVISTEPAYETVEDQWNAPVFASGALVFALSYGGSVVAAASRDAEERDRWAERLYVPVVGPWLALNDHGACPIERPSCDDETTTKVLLVADGVLQATGVITMVAGLLQPTHHRRVVRMSANDTKVRVRPSVGRGGSGLEVFGRF
jgi:hypothetical protein